MIKILKNILVAAVLLFAAPIHAQTQVNPSQIKNVLSFNGLADIGSANVYLVSTGSIPYSTLITGTTITFKAAHQNTGASTFNVNSIGPKAILKIGNTSALVSGDIQTGQEVTVVYDGTQWEMQSILGNSQSGGFPVGSTGDTQEKATATTFGAAPAHDTGTLYQIKENSCLAGPSPWIDVTCPPYNAIADNSTDNAAAIQAAITAACNAGVFTGTEHATLLFPFGTTGIYLVSQPQTPSTSTVFTIPCTLSFVGMGSFASGAQFVRMPNVQIAVIPGASPNAYPVFHPQFGAGGNSTFENLTITGYNQAMQVSVGDVTLKNVCLTTYASGMSDNTPLLLYNLNWFWMYGGCLQSGGANLNTMIMVGAAGAAPEVGPVVMKDVHISGGGFLYSQRANQSGPPSGGWVFENLQVENSGLDFLHIQNDTGSAGNVGMPNIGPLSIDYLLDSDATNSTNAVIGFNSSGSNLIGVYMNHVAAGGAMGPAIRMSAGTLLDAKIFSCPRNFGACSQPVVDGSGNAVGGVATSNDNGFDYTVNTSDASRLETSKQILNNDFNSGNALRLFAAGSNFSTFQVDPIEGALFGPGNYGYSGAISQATEETVGIYVATTLPPTSVSATPTTGGTLANGTYYYYLTASNDSCGGTAESAPSLAGTVVLTGGNNAVALSWTLPVSTPTTPAGYCVIRSQVGPIYDSAANNFGGQYVSGASTTTYTDTGFSACCWGVSAVNRMSEAHRFTANALGINTATPVYDLDVVHTSAANKGERAAAYATATNCSSSAAPAVCGSSASGSVVIASGGATTVVVDTSAVTAASQIQITFDSSLGTKLSVTCNTTAQQPYVTARSAGVSFTLSVPAMFSTNPGCFSYSIIN